MRDTVRAPAVCLCAACAQVLNSASPFQRERLAPLLLKPNWIPRLIDVFKQAEDLDDAPTLAHMYGAVKGAIMLNDAGVLEELLKVQASGCTGCACAHPSGAPAGACAEGRAGKGQLFKCLSQLRGALSSGRAQQGTAGAAVSASRGKHSAAAGSLQRPPARP